MNSSPAPEWFAHLIGQGLASLYLLTLEGCPANDSTGKVGALWTGVLWNRRRWYEEDAPRIRTAFAAMCAGCKRWPTPATFLEHLPDRPPRKQAELMGPTWGRQNEAAVLDGMRKQFRELGLEDRLPASLKGDA